MTHGTMSLQPRTRAYHARGERAKRRIRTPWNFDWRQIMQENPAVTTNEAQSNELDALQARCSGATERPHAA